MPQRAVEASADSRIASGAPAFYIQQGDKDPAVNVRQAIDFYGKLKASGFLREEDLVLDILKGAPHAGAGPEFLEPANVKPILEFFISHMR